MGKEKEAKKKGLAIGTGAILGVAFAPGPILLLGGVCAAGFLIAHHHKNKKEERRRKRQQQQQRQPQQQTRVDSTRSSSSSSGSNLGRDGSAGTTSASGATAAESYHDLGRWLEHVSEADRTSRPASVVEGALVGVPLSELPTALPVPGLDGSFVCAWDWAVSPSEKQDYSAIFKICDTSNHGYLSYQDTRAVMQQTLQEQDRKDRTAQTSTSASRSRSASSSAPHAHLLPSSVLDSAMHLADIDADGKYDEEEFALLIHLLRMYRASGVLPPCLTRDLIPPCKRLLVGSTVFTNTSTSTAGTSRTTSTTVTATAIASATPLSSRDSELAPPPAARATIIRSHSAQQPRRASPWDAMPLSASSSASMSGR